MKKKSKLLYIFAVFRPWLRLFVLLLLVGLTFSYTMFQGGFVSWFLFYTFLPFAIYSILLAVYPLKVFKITRNITPKECKAGEKITVQLTLKRKIPFPIPFLIVEDILPFRLLNQSNKTIIFPGFKKQLSIQYEVNDVPRGEHHFDEIRIKLGDPLGLVEKERVLQNKQTILVYPQYEEIMYRPFLSRYEQGASAALLQFQKDTSQVAGVRDYQPGDRFSWVDWKATARTNQMMSKEFEIRQTNDLLIILDLFPSKYFEEAVTFAASVTRAGLKNGSQVGFLTAGKNKVFLPVRGGEQQRQEIFLHLAKVNPDSHFHLSTIFEEVTELYYQSATVIVITGALDQHLINSAMLFARRKSAFFIFYINKRSAKNNQEELKIQSLALNRGLNLKIVHDDEFRTAFSGVEHR